MEKTILLLITIFITSIICNAQKDENKIEWSASKKLTWDDFKGKPDNSTSDKACTYGVMSYDSTVSISTICGNILYQFLFKVMVSKAFQCFISFHAIFNRFSKILYFISCFENKKLGILKI